MKRVIGDRERAQRAAARLRVLQHCEQVSRNISRTCRFFEISRTLFYEWRRRYQREGLDGLRPRLPGPRVSPFRTAPHIEALLLRVRQERQYGIPRLRLFLRRYHAVSLSPPTIRGSLPENRIPAAGKKASPGFRPCGLSSEGIMPAPFPRPRSGGSYASTGFPASRKSGTGQDR